MEPATIIDDQLREVSLNAQAAHEALTHYLASSDLVGRWVTLEVGEDAERERGRLWDLWEAANDAYRRFAGDDYYPGAWCRVRGCGHDESSGSCRAGRL